MRNRLCLLVHFIFVFQQKAYNKLKSYMVAPVTIKWRNLEEEPFPPNTKQVNDSRKIGEPISKFIKLTFETTITCKVELYDTVWKCPFLFLK